MKNLPRVNGPIFDTGEVFTPDNWSFGWAAIASEIESAFRAGGVSSGGFSTDITGYGRIASADYFEADATAPRPPSSPAPALEILNGKWGVEDRLIVIDEPTGFLLLTGVPLNMLVGKYGYLSTREIEGSDGEWTLEILPARWFDALQPALSAQGLACIGRVFSNTETVTAIDPTFADVIVPLFALRAQIKALGGNNEDGDSTGEVARTEFNGLKNTVEQMGILIAALQERIGATGATSTISDPDRYETRENARQTVQLTKLDATYSLKTDGSVFIPGTAGNSEDLDNGLTARQVHSGNTLLDLDTGEER